MRSVSRPTFSFHLFGRDLLSNLSSRAWTGLTILLLPGKTIQASFGMLGHATCLGAKTVELHAVPIFTPLAKPENCSIIRSHMIRGLVPLGLRPARLVTIFD